MQVSLALAFAAGLVSFASPCVLALVPVYLAFLGEAAGGSALASAGAGAATAGTATAGAATAGTGSLRAPRHAVLAQALLFIGGFSAIFVLLGVSIGLLGAPVFRIDVVRQAAGIGVIALGVLMTGVFGPVLDRFSLGLSPQSLPAARSVRSASLGALVAVGWTPCIGPVLSAILTMGLSSADVGIAAVLLIAYSAGLAVPFVAAALALPRLRPLFDVLRRHHRFIEVLSGLFVIGVGILILTNAFARMAGLFTFVL
jgi:cytochrome c-type biogenesis protein